jgi:hypothetical protein
MKQGADHMKIKTHLLMQLGIGALLTIALFTIESRSIVGALAAHKGITGISWALISGSFALLALTAYGIAGFLKDDYREHVARRAKQARAIAIVAMLVPASFFGSAVKADNIADRWSSYIAAGPTGKSQYDLDIATIADPMGDPLERGEARGRISANTPGPIALDILDGEFWMGVFFQLILLVGADALRIPAPMTAQEYEHLKRSAAAKKGAATRKARKVIKKKTEADGRFNVVRGGKG